uniref:ribosomal protein L22 n=1 Tax=Drosera capensis TaxID=4366 RepID=UPI00241161AD|nr:ribosomal protein L22 [Drosera capensis]WEQ03465.1 ribosomal protein L22 [Drosera capensis]
MIKKHKTTYSEFPDISTSGHYIPMSAQKARRISDLIREIPYEDALRILEFIPYRASYPILKLIYSGGEKAAKSHDKDELIISGIEVNEGPTKKRLKPKAQGRSCLIKKSTCHITVRFNNINNIEKGHRESKRLGDKMKRRQSQSERLSKKLKEKWISMSGRGVK